LRFFAAFPYDDRAPAATVATPTDDSDDDASSGAAAAPDDADAARPAVLAGSFNPPHWGHLQVRDRAKSRS
jgi:hypothetical protein